MIKYSYETTARHASRLAAVLRAGRETVSIDTAVQALGVDRRTRPYGYCPNGPGRAG
jgi:hypothetical protein